VLPASLTMALNTTYYVDSVSGSESYSGTSPTAAWKTLTDTSKVNSTVFGPGDTILFKRGGNWAGRLEPDGLGGASGAPLTLGAYGDPADPLPHIQGSNGAAIKLYNKSWITVQDFDLTNNPAQTPFARNGVHLIFSVSATSAGKVFSGIKIQNNLIHDIVGYTTRGTNLENYTNAGIFVESSGTVPCSVDDFRIENNNIYNVKCIGIFFKPGTFMNGNQSTWMKNLVIRNNLINQTGGDHIVVQGADGPLIEYNAGYDAGILAVPNANLWIAGMWVGYNTRNSTFQFNEVARTVTQYVGGNGDSMAFDVDYGTIDNHIFQYNYSHDNEGGAMLMMPPAPIQGTNPTQYYPPAAKTIIYRYNISANDNRNNASGRQVIMETVSGTNSAHIYNNVFYNERPLGIRVSDTPAEYYSNNIFYAPQGHYGSRSRFSNNCFYGHVPVVTDPYKVLADPKFVGPLPGTGVVVDAYKGTNPPSWNNLQTYTNPFKLQASSPCINAGKTITTPISNGGRDFWNNPLYSGAADIGVHEVPSGTTAPPATVTIIDNVDPAVTYSGTAGGVPWSLTSNGSFENNTVAVSDTVGTWAQCSFVGTNVSFYTMRGPGSGRAYISIDGGPTQLVDMYWPIARMRQEMFQVTGLTSGTHTIRVAVTTKNSASTWPGVHVDYFQVLPGNPPPPPKVAIIDDTAGIYDANWSTSNPDQEGYLKTLHTSSTIGSTASFSFVGTGVRILGPKDRARGNMTVTVDGVSKLVSCYTPGNYKEVASRLFEVYGLPYGSHNVTVTVETKDPSASGNSVAIDMLEAVTDTVVDNVPGSAVVYTTAAGKTAWTHSEDPAFLNNTKSVTDQIGNYVTFTFTGTGAAIYAKKDSGLGKLNVQVDGGAATSVDCYSPTQLQRQKVFEVTGLASGTHTIRATVATKNPASASNFIGLDYFTFEP
jgi:hypothetical protein